MKKQLLLLSAALSTLLLTACGDTKETTDNNYVINGKAIDGYLQQSTICVDLSRDDSCEGEKLKTTTNDLGEYSLSISDSDLKTVKEKKIPLLVYGGVDSDTNQEFTGKLKAIIDPEQSTTNITPISSVVFNAYKNGATLIDAQLKTAEALGVKESDLNIDYIDNKNSEAQAVALTLQKTLEVIASSNISGAYTNLGKSVLEFNATSSNSLVELLSSLDNNDSTAQVATLVNSFASTISQDEVNRTNAITLLQENLETIKEIAETNNTQLQTSLETLITAAAKNDINTSLKATYINKLLLNSLEVKDVTKLIDQLDGSLVNLDPNMSIEEIVKVIEKDNPGLITVTLQGAIEILKTGGIELSKDFFTKSLFDDLLSDGNISRVLSPTAFLQFAIENSGDLFSKVVKNSDTLNQFFNDKPNPTIQSALYTANLGLGENALSSTTIDTLASIKIGSDNNTSGFVSLATTALLPSRSSDSSFVGSILDFILPSKSEKTTTTADTSLTHTLLIKAIVKAANSLGYQITDADAEKFLELNSDISISNLKNSYTVLQTFLESKSN